MMIARVHKASQVAACKWWYAVAVGWILLVGLPLIPAYIWFEVDRVHVYDTVAGQNPMMAVKRAINLPFRGRWTATVLRQNPDGSFYTYCVSTGENDYRPENHLPLVTNLDWWTWPVKCELPVGTYKLNTLWTLSVPLLPQKNVRAESNVFQVKSPG